MLSSSDWNSKTQTIEIDTRFQILRMHSPSSILHIASDLKNSKANAPLSFHTKTLTYETKPIRVQKLTFSDKHL